MLAYQNPNPRDRKIGHLKSLTSINNPKVSNPAAWSVYIRFSLHTWFDSHASRGSEEEGGGEKKKKRRIWRKKERKKESGYWGRGCGDGAAAHSHVSQLYAAAAAVDSLVLAEPLTRSGHRLQVLIVCSENLLHHDGLFKNPTRSLPK